MPGDVLNGSLRYYLEPFGTCFVTTAHQSDERPMPYIHASIRVSLREGRVKMLWIGDGDLLARGTVAMGTNPGDPGTGIGTQLSWASRRESAMLATIPVRVRLDLV